MVDSPSIGRVKRYIFWVTSGDLRLYGYYWPWESIHARDSQGLFPIHVAQVWQYAGCSGQREKHQKGNCHCILLAPGEIWKSSAFWMTHFHRPYFSKTQTEKHLLIWQWNRLTRHQLSMISDSLQERHLVYRLMCVSLGQRCYRLQATKKSRQLRQVILS